MICSKCGKPTDRSYAGMCQGCYKYYHSGGTDNPLPPLGKVEYDHRGYVICHICGRAYKRLGSHIKESHGLTIAEYKAKFELCNNAKTTESNYSEHMHNLAYKYDMPKRLQITGYPTRIKKGEKDKRYGKKVRLQECLDRSERYRRETK
jgi:NMD protein affecting ribosome stability and mRNA decay